jgi:FKBP-type peptidyl-prolyl cis-trans isomerase 2
LENGEIVDSTERFPPVEFQVGGSTDRNGFGSEIIGMKINEVKEFTLLCDETLGYPVQGKIKEIPLSNLKSEVAPKVGIVMLFHIIHGPVLPGTVVEIKEDSILVDFSHPLAGKELKYQVRVLEINDHRTGTRSYSDKNGWCPLISRN